VTASGRRRIEVCSGARLHGRQRQLIEVQRSELAGDLIMRRIRGDVARLGGGGIGNWAASSSRSSKKVPTPWSSFTATIAFQYVTVPQPPVSKRKICCP